MTRDTDLDWKTIAEHHPYFGVLANEQYLSHNLTPERIEEFYASGRADIDAVVETLRRLIAGRRRLATPLPKFQPRSAIDFGCGVGRLTLAMARHAKTVVGVDVSERMLELAKERANSTGVHNVEFHTDIPSTGVEWVNSLIVFQHIPPPRGLGLLEKLVSRLEAGGYLSVQLTFYRDAEHAHVVAERIGDHRFDGRTLTAFDGLRPGQPGEMLMFDYDLNGVFRMLFASGLEQLWVEHTYHGGYHGVYLYGVKSAS